MTKAVLEILPREARTEEEIELLSKFSLLIDEFINFGTHVLKWEIETARGGDENIPIAMMFRHILELGDSISLLVKSSSIDPCKLQLRGLLEALFGLEYILEKDTHNRAMGFMVWHHHKQLKIYKRFDPTSQTHKELIGIVRKDKFFDGDFSLPVIPEIQSHIENLELLLSTPAYKLAQAEYLRHDKQSWFELFGGPGRKIEQLANYLGRQAFYEFLYRNWSGPTHGTDVFNGKIFPSEGDDGKASYVQLRFAKDTQEVVQYTLHFLLLAFNLIIDKRIPQHKTDLSDWYLTIQKPYLEVTTQRIITHSTKGSHYPDQ